MGAARTRGSWRGRGRLEVDAALEFLAAPAAGSHVGRVNRDRRARLAPDARVTRLVQRQEWYPVFLRVIVDFFRGPRRHRVHLAQHATRWQPERLQGRKVRAAGRLIAPQSGEPPVVVIERSEQGAYLVAGAARVGAALPQPDRWLRRFERDQIQVPPLCE